MTFAPRPAAAPSAGQSPLASRPDLPCGRGRRPHPPPPESPALPPPDRPRRGNATPAGHHAAPFAAPNDSVVEWPALEATTVAHLRHTVPAAAAGLGFAGGCRCRGRRVGPQPLRHRLV